VVHDAGTWYLRQMSNQPALPAALAAGNVAVVTGAASGIGFAALLIPGTRTSKPSSPAT
jgi:hypothetical protein